MGVGLRLLASLARAHTGAPAAPCPPATHLARVLRRWGGVGRGGAGRGHPLAALPPPQPRLRPLTPGALPRQKAWCCLPAPPLTAEPQLPPL